MSHERDERSREEPAAPAGAREARCEDADGPERKRVAETRIRLRRMQLSHIDALMPYEREMFGTEAWSRSSYRDELLDTRNRYYVAAENDAGELIGWGGVLIVQDGAEILTVGVVPAARRAGAARLMLADLLAEAVRRGAREAFLEVRVDNDAARALYAREGFTEIGRRRGYYDGGRVDAVTMRKELTQ